MKSFSKTQKFLFILLTAVIMFAMYLLCTSSSVKREVYRESFSLSGQEEKKFLHRPLKDEEVMVYKYDNSGNLIFFEEGKDYVIDYVNGTIQRTYNSRIPDYANHNVIYKNDVFVFSSEEIRNPELNVEYQVLVDYTYRTILEKYVSIEKKSHFLSESTRDKLRNGEEITICLIGDSIATGAQTISEYYFSDNISSTFLGYLKEELEQIYGCEVNAELISKVGESREFLLNNTDKILEKKPDIVLIEFGMNDHIGADAMLRIDSFEKDMETAVDFLIDAGCDVALIGFFQQNNKWELENEIATVEYNEVLQKIARVKGIYFADIFSSFERLPRKNMMEDVMADYMHHPTDFGHMIYYTEIIPLFLLEDTKSVDLKYYIYY